LDSDRFELALPIFRLFDALSRFSRAPLERLAKCPDRFLRLFAKREFLVYAGRFLNEICKIDKQFALAMVLKFKIFEVITNLIQTETSSLEFIGQLFHILAIVIGHIDVAWGGFRPEYGEIWEIPRDICAIYLASNNLLVLPSVLEAFGQLLVKWPVELDALFTPEVAERLVAITASAHTIPGVANLVMSRCLSIWQRIVYRCPECRVILLPKLVRVLADQLPRFPGSGPDIQSKILFLFGNLAFFPEAGIGATIYECLMSQFHNVSFTKKESLVMIFCNLASRHPRLIIEAGHHEDILLEALDTVEGSSSSVKLRIAFLKALHCLFSEDNDTISIFDGSELMTFLSDISSQSDSESGELAERLMDDFLRQPPLDPSIFLIKSPFSSE
jgi:hypothetical protein